MTSLLLIPSTTVNPIALSGAGWLVGRVWQAAAAEKTAGLGSLLQQHDAERAVRGHKHGVRRRVEGDAGGLHGESI